MARFASTGSATWVHEELGLRDSPVVALGLSFRHHSVAGAPLDAITQVSSSTSGSRLIWQD
jgi:hypothetical protein